MTPVLNLDNGTNNTPVLHLPNDDRTEDQAYVDTMLQLMGGQETVDQIRKRQFDDADNNSLNSLVKVMEGLESDETRIMAENLVGSYAALSALDKVRSDVNVINQELADIEVSNTFKDNPQALYNYMLDNTDKFRDVSIYDNRYVTTMQELSKVIDEDSFGSSIAKRIFRDLAISAVGGKAAKSAKPLVKGVGKILSAEGAGVATDVAFLGSTVHSMKEEASTRWLACLSASDEEYPKALADLIDFVKSVPKIYHPEIQQAIEEGPSVYDDAGAAFTSSAMRMYGATAVSTMKGLGTLLKYGNKAQRHEELVKSPSRALVPYKEHLPAVLDGEEVAQAIENRQAAMIPYMPRHVAVIEDGRPKLALLEDNREQVVYLPTGEKITYLGRPEKRLLLEDKTEKEWFNMAEEDLVTGEKNTNTRTWLPEQRRIRYTYNNQGRGYTYDEAKEQVRNLQSLVMRYVKNRKFYGHYIDREEDRLLNRIPKYQPWNVTSAAAPVPFTRGQATPEILGKGEGSQFYGPTGPYSSLETTQEHSWIDHDKYPASRGHYAYNLDEQLLADVYDKAHHRTYLDFVHTGDLSEKAFEDITQYILIDRITNDDALLKYRKNYSQGLYDLKDVLKVMIEEVKLNPHFTSMQKKAAIYFLKEMIREVKDKRTGIINTWAVKQWNPKKTIDQRYQNNSNFNVMNGQTPEVRKGIGKTTANLVKMLEEANISLKGNREPADIGRKKDIAFGLMFKDWAKHLNPKYLNPYNLSVLSKQYPWWLRLAFDQMTEEELWKYGFHYNNLYVPNNLKKVDLKGLRQEVIYRGQRLFADTLYKNGIEMAVQSNTNMVVFKDTKRLYTDVQKQEYNQNGWHYQRILDNGALMRYDPEIQAFVIDVYVSTKGGKGRRPIIVHKEKLDVMDPKRNKSMRNDDDD
jgi:hypothetical protein